MQTLKISLRTLLFLLILTTSFLPFAGVGLAQQLEPLTGESVSPQSDAARLFRAVEENSILKQQLEVANEKLANKIKELELAEKELEIKDKLIEIEQKRTEVYKEAFEKEKELTDRALKLADSTKKGNWELVGVLGVIAVIVTVIATVL